MVTKIQVMGPFNSGTNLVTDILMDNSIDMKDEKVETCENMLMWKHTLRTDFIANKIKIPTNLFIIMYKNVYNWLFSIQKNPYDITLNNGICGTAEMQGFKYDNVIQLHNRYYNMYRSMLKDYPKQVVYLDYYKIIQENPTEYINSKLEKIGVRIKDVKKIEKVLSEPSKNHGKDCVKNASDARWKYDRVQSMMKTYVSSNPRMRSMIRNDIMEWFENENNFED